MGVCIYLGVCFGIPDHRHFDRDEISFRIEYSESVW